MKNFYKKLQVFILQLHFLIRIYFCKNIKLDILNYLIINKYEKLVIK